MSKPKTVQEYLDESPHWADGTVVGYGPPLTEVQWRIWALTTAGKFFEGMVVFMTGVALPLVTLQYGLNATEKGVISSAILFGILIGATALGGLSDRVGRKPMFIVEIALFIVFLIAAAASPNFWVLVVSLFGVGLALGCDYPTAHAFISETTGSAVRGRLVLSAFGFQAVGAAFGTVVGYAILRLDGGLESWRWMYGVTIIPALLVLIGRFFIPNSGHWLMTQGRIADAEEATKSLLTRHPQYPKTIRLRDPHADKPKKKMTFGRLFIKKKNRRATILASVPWFLQDLSTYGIGIFTPIILATTLGAENTHPRNLSEVVHKSMQAAEGAAIIDILLIVGIVVAVLLVDRVGRIRMQILGFVGCALGLFIAALSTYFSGTFETVLIFLGFMLFNFMTNMGPNAMTYLLAGEVFPTKARGMGAGFAASFAKVGAVLTAFWFPILLAKIGTATLLYGLVGASLLGAYTTWRFRIETRRINLEKMELD